MSSSIQNKKNQAKKKTCGELCFVRLENILVKTWSASPFLRRASERAKFHPTLVERLLSIYNAIYTLYTCAVCKAAGSLQLLTLSCTGWAILSCFLCTKKKFYASHYIYINDEDISRNASMRHMSLAGHADSCGKKSTTTCLKFLRSDVSERWMCVGCSKTHVGCTKRKLNHRYCDTDTPWSTCAWCYIYTYTGLSPALFTVSSSWLSIMMLVDASSGWAFGAADEPFFFRGLHCRELVWILGKKHPRASNLKSPCKWLDCR